MKEETERDEAGFLRCELRGETQGSRVECLACSNSAGKKVFTTAARWNWNRHVQLKHKSQPASGQDAKPATVPVAEPAAEPAALSQQKGKPARRSTRGRGDSASAKILPPLLCSKLHSFIMYHQSQLILMIRLILQFSHMPSCTLWR